MIVSWNWLKQYIALDMPVEELTQRLMMAGLNHESTSDVGGDIAIDLEVTSNRPDCLSHLGIAREVGVLWGREVKFPAAAPPSGQRPVAELASVEVQNPTLCPRYTARVITGVKIAPSPAAIVRRLATLGIAAINNVVDATNYVLMECGQPLHAFDLGMLRGRRIIVREAVENEPFQAINHKTYQLSAGMCVIADGERPVGLAGVMGGADSEISDRTRDVLLEAADFAPLAIRTTSRKLGLRSDSSYRFERGVDPERIDWASRRCCELILEWAGGELAQGVLDVGAKPAPRPPVVLRLSQIPRVLGISIDTSEVRRILQALGLQEVRHDAQTVHVSPPSHRRDLTREIDLIEEVARIHGYEAIPEDVRVPMSTSRLAVDDVALGRVRHALTAQGFDEAMTLSLVTEDLSQAFSPWTSATPLRAEEAIVGGADRLRRSLIPSLLAARRGNEALSNPVIELFEMARVYLPQSGGLPEEPQMLALTSGAGFLRVKGVLEAILHEVNPALALTVRPCEGAFFAPGRGVWLQLGEERIGCLGEVSTAAAKAFELRSPTTVAELRLAPLIAQARLNPTFAPLSAYPPITRDLNVVFDDIVRWEAVAAAVRQRAGKLLEELLYQETYRHKEQLGPGKKSLLFRLVLRRNDRTLTSEEADQVRDEIVVGLAALGGKLRA